MTAAVLGDALHQACVYGSDDEFLAMAMPFVNDGLDAGEPVLVTTTAANLELLGAAMGERADRVDYAETAYFGRRPHQRVAAFRDYWERNAGPPDPGHVRILAEPVWAGRSARDTVAWRRMESGLNVLMADTNVWMICPYDRRAVDPAIVTAACQTHPSLVAAAGANASEAYVDPYAYAQQCDAASLPPPPPDAAETHVTDNLDAVREFTTDQAAANQLAEQQVAMAVMAVNEAVTYLLTQDPSGVTVRMWTEFGALVCELDCAGAGPEDPFVGFRPPGLQPQPEDRFWLVRQICAHVDTRVTDAGCALRLHLPTGRDEELLNTRYRAGP